MKTEKTECVEKEEKEECDWLKNFLEEATFKDFYSLYNCEPIPPTEEEREMIEARLRYRRDRREYERRE